MKKILMFSVLLMLPIFVKADHMYNVDMNIDIDKYGNANITEVWDVKATTGSEWYKSIYNLNNSKLNNYKVMQDGVPLSYKYSWNINDSMSQKKGFYGINNTSDGIELCFGKGDYLRHQFTITYSLSNYIFNTNDAQVLYWTLMPEVKVDNFNVVVKGFYNFPNTLDVWGYGYKGMAYVSGGVIKMYNKENLNNNRVVLLAKFPLNTFNTNNINSLYSDFNSVYQKAQEGSYKYNNKKNSFVNFTFTIIIFGLLIYFKYFFKKGNSSKNIKIEKYYGFKDNKKIDKDTVPMFREIPCNKDIYYANALLKLNGYFYKQSRIIGAIILKWVKNDKVKFNKEDRLLDLTKDVSFGNYLEHKLFDMMYKASKDGILEVKELENWAKSNYYQFTQLIDEYSNTVIADLKQQGHIYQRTISSECRKDLVMNDLMYEDSVKLYGLKRYLDEFSLIDTKEVLDVKLWDEYLMFACLLGNAKKVAKQLKKLYPEEFQEYNIDYDILLFLDHLVVDSFNSANSSKAYHEWIRDKDANSYSSGGGGYSSDGGGGSSSGDGGSMGGR